MEKDMKIVEEDLPMLKPGEEMMMTEDEICFRFRRNGCYNAHLLILAQLNAVYPNIIAKILYEKGLFSLFPEIIRSLFYSLVIQ